jgi:hypothetical protein
MIDSEQAEAKNRFNPNSLPTLNRHYRFADQILYGQKVRKETSKQLMEFECHNCIREKCKQHTSCEQFARLKAAEMKELMKP